GNKVKDNLQAAFPHTYPMRAGNRGGESGGGQPQRAEARAGAQRTMRSPIPALALGGIDGQVVRVNEKTTKRIRPFERQQVETSLGGGNNTLIPVPGTGRT